MAHYADKYNRALRNKAKEATLDQKAAQEYQEKSKQIRVAKESFLNRKFDYRDYIMAVEGYEGIILTLYILIIPYLTGLSFLFLFVARTNFYLFLELKLSSYLIIWAIGYEVCAVLALVIIGYAWLNNSPSDNSTNGRPAPRFR